MPVALWWERIRFAGVSSVVTLGRGLYAVIAVPVLLYTSVTCVVGIGFVLVPPQLWLLGRIGDAERKRLARVAEGPEFPIGRPFRWLPSLVSDRTVWRELRWAVVMLFAGTVLGLLGVAIFLLPVMSFAAIWLWWLFPPHDPIRVVANVPITGWWSAFTVGIAQTVITAAVAIVCGPLVARAGLWVSRAGLRPSAKYQLAQEITVLRSSRSGAVDAHAADLRRIERDLHDGTQAHLVSLALRLGLALRVLQRDPAAVAPLLEQARSGAEAAMSDLRTVLRTTYPPILSDHGLDGALSAVAASCTVPTQVRVNVGAATPAAVEAAVYFVVTEALTNIARHSGARAASVDVRMVDGCIAVEVRDDGRGGVDESRGTGVSGMRRRVAALDGLLAVDSPPGGPTILRAACPCE
ncbi:sensor histidine kinase [Nocardia sp. NBC_01327]|uniref:sensor histidine kinase n=1 Tax=Nocardia sp. NBC_01327 TaxID=2903593 RepID=UPI002E163BC8|nr:histidine kinase [Nocardia sp. NBC_01327]